MTYGNLPTLRTVKKVWEFSKLEAAFSEVQPFLSEPVTRPVGLLRPTK